MNRVKQKSASPKKHPNHPKKQQVFLGKRLVPFTLFKHLSPFPLLILVAFILSSAQLSAGKSLETTPRTRRIPMDIGLVKALTTTRSPWKVCFFTAAGWDWSCQGGDHDQGALANHFFCAWTFLGNILPIGKWCQMVSQSSKCKIVCNTICGLNFVAKEWPNWVTRPLKELLYT